MVEDYKYFEKGEQAYTLGYTIYYYVQLNWYFNNEWAFKMLKIDGVLPSGKTILSKEYLVGMNYFAVIRKDTPADDPARIIANWITTEEGQEEVKNSGLGESGCRGIRKESTSEKIDGDGLDRTAKTKHNGYIIFDLMKRCI